MSLAVVARFQEAFDWSLCPWPVQIVQKDRDLPNMGRETSSYCWWIATHYHQIDPERTFAFLQGNPMPHAFQWSQLRPVEQFEPLGGYHLTEFPDGRPNHPGLQLERAWVELDIVGSCPIEFRYTAGAQFLVPGRVLLRRPPEWWRWLQRRVSEKDAWLNPWVLERLWRYLLAG